MHWEHWRFERSVSQLLMRRNCVGSQCSLFALHTAQSITRMSCYARRRVRFCTSITALTRNSHSQGHVRCQWHQGRRRARGQEATLARLAGRPIAVVAFDYIEMFRFVSNAIKLEWNQSGWRRVRDCECVCVCCDWTDTCTKCIWDRSRLVPPSSLRKESIKIDSRKRCANHGH
jgi:hypothetical protein